MTIDQTLKRDLLKTTTPNAGGDQSTRAASQSGANNLDQHLVASSKQVLLKCIHFHPAERDISFQLQNLRVKYVALNPSQSDAEKSNKTLPNNNHSQMNGQVEVRHDGIPAPKKILYPLDKITLAWQRCQRVGPGLINMGNTCFLNATLQCLTYTPPLANYLLSQQHKHECRELGFCIVCELCNHVHRTFVHQQNGQAIRPMVILHKLKHFAKHMHIGRQEDAHEFLRLLIEAMQKTCIHGLEKLDKYSKETSVIYQIFSGYYRSRVICSVCQNKSDTYEPFLDIGLDIKQAPTVTKALERLIRPEMLDGENLYQCKKCNRKVQAQKRFTIQRAPNVLTLCLKRFDFNRFNMGKINKELAYADHLNLRPYMSDPKGSAIVYELYAVLKHEGASCNSGHYYCFVKAANQSWYCMNDAYVSHVSQQRVLNQNAYLLFYIRKNSFKSPMNGGEPKRDVLQTKNPKPATTISKPQSVLNGPLGTPVPRPSPNTQAMHQPNPGFKPRLITEEKDKCPVKLSSQQQQKQQQQKQQQQKQQQQPHEIRHSLPKMVPPREQRDKLTFQFRAKSAVGTTTPNSFPQHQQPPPFGKKQVAASPSASASTIQSPVMAGAGDASTKQNAQQQDQSSTAKKTFSPLKLNQTSPPTLTSPTALSKDPLRFMQGLVKPKARLAQDASNTNGVCKNQVHSGLVPYTAEDSNSSSDSETNYDKVVEQLCMTQVGDVRTCVLPDKLSQLKTENHQGDLPVANKSKENVSDSTPMKPPSTAIKSTPLDSLQLSPSLLKKANLANSTNLTTIRKPDSPLKLTITTNGQAQRIKSTTHWRTGDSDSQISPSPASDCSLHSNVSTNSTSEWNILEKRDAPHTPQEVKKEAAVFGWSITPSPFKNAAEKVLHDSTEESRTKLFWPKVALKFDTAQDQALTEKEQNRNVSISQDRTKPASNDNNPDCKSLKSDTVLIDTCEASNNIEGSNKCSSSEKTSEKQQTQEEVPSGMHDEPLNTRDEYENGASKKKKKKKKKKHLHSPPPATREEEHTSSTHSEIDEEEANGAVNSESQHHEVEYDSDHQKDSDQKRKKKKKKKKKKEKRDEEEEEDVEEEWVERIIETQENTRELLLCDSESQQDKKRKHKSDKDKHKAVQNKRDGPSDDETNHTHSKTHNKGKKHSDKHALIRRTLEKKIKRHRNHHNSSDCRESSSKHDDDRRHTSNDDGHSRSSLSQDQSGQDVTAPSHKHSKRHKDKSRKSHSYDDHSASDHSEKASQNHKDTEEANSYKEKHTKKLDDRCSNSADRQTSKHPKLHKELRHKDSDDESKYSESNLRLNGDDDYKKRKEKKKKRKHREEDSDKRLLLSVNDEEEDYRPEKKKKKKMKHNHNSSDGEEDGRTEEQVTSKKSKDEAPVQQWDHHIQDRHAKKHSDDDTSIIKTKTTCTWDGTHSSSGVVEELGKSSLKAYGPSIKSWDGGCSALDNEVAYDSRQEKRRDPYEEDFDRGKVKKVKKHHEDDSRFKIFSGRNNLFQSVQNMRNKVPYDKDHHGHSRFSSQSYREHPR